MYLCIHEERKKDRAAPEAFPFHVSGAQVRAACVQDYGIHRGLCPLQPRHNYGDDSADQTPLSKIRSSYPSGTDVSTHNLMYSVFID